jgi:hypothetical protein
MKITTALLTTAGFLINFVFIHCWLSSGTALQTVDTFSLYTANVGHKTSYTIKSTRKEQTTRKKKKNGTAAAAEYTFNDL